MYACPPTSNHQAGKDVNRATIRSLVDDDSCGRHEATVTLNWAMFWGLPSTRLCEEEDRSHMDPTVSQSGRRTQSFGGNLGALNGKNVA